MAACICSSPIATSSSTRDALRALAVAACTSRSSIHMPTLWERPRAARRGRGGSTTPTPTPTPTPSSIRRGVEDSMLLAGRASLKFPPLAPVSCRGPRVNRSKDACDCRSPLGACGETAGALVRKTSMLGCLSSPLSSHTPPPALAAPAPIPAPAPIVPILGDLDCSRSCAPALMLRLGHAFSLAFSAGGGGCRGVLPEVPGGALGLRGGPLGLVAGLRGLMLLRGLGRPWRVSSGGYGFFSSGGVGLLTCSAPTSSSPLLFLP